MLIGLMGKKQVGKDTVANHLGGKYSFRQLAFADPLKEMCASITNTPLINWYNNNLKDKHLDNHFSEFTYRQFMQHMGDAIRNGLSEKAFIISTFDRMHNFDINGLHCNTVISDIRFDNELEFVYNIGGKIIHIIRPQEENDTHISEQMILSTKQRQFVDKQLINDSTIDNLLNSVDLIIQEYRKK
jgi:hypothetical protein